MIESDLTPVGAPPCNTGALVNLQESEYGTFGIGWLSFTAKGEFPLQEIKKYWSAITNDEFPEPGKGIFGYDNSQRSALGVLVAFSSNRTDVLFQFSQSSLELLPLEDLRAFLTWLVASYQINFTRLDINADDLKGHLTKSKLREAYQANNFRTRSQQRKWIETAPGEDAGFTLYIGSRRSQTFTRIYDKAAESDLDFFCTRVEVELKAEQAATQIALFINRPVSEWAETILSIIRSAVDIVDMAQSANSTLCPLLDFWERFVHSVPKFRLPVPKNPISITKVVDWVQRQFSSTLHFFELYFGKDDAQFLLQTIADDAKGRLNAKQKYLLNNTPGIFPFSLDNPAPLGI